MTEKRKLKFIWIDDDPGREVAAHNIKDSLDVDIEFIDVKGKNLEEELNRLFQGEPGTAPAPSLILMDHKLQDIKSSGLQTGSTAAEVIRENEGWADCPIVCITGVALHDIDTHKKSLYEEVFEIHNISSHYSTLRSLAESFQHLKKIRPRNIADFLNLLQYPEPDKERLYAVIPRELKKKDFYEDKSLLLFISHWVRHTLIERPGFLFDRMWAATLLGIREESFEKVEELFKEALYNGIFADHTCPSEQRWWQSKIREILFCQFPDNNSLYPWELGRLLPGINEEDYSGCRAGINCPDTVAYTDEKAGKRVQIPMRETVSHPTFEKLLFFEEIRMMKGAE